MHELTLAASVECMCHEVLSYLPKTAEPHRNAEVSAAIRDLHRSRRLLPMRINFEAKFFFSDAWLREIADGGGFASLL